VAIKYFCDQCGTELKQHLGNVSIYTEGEGLAFCDWACLADYAEAKVGAA